MGLFEWMPHVVFASIVAGIAMPLLQVFLKLPWYGAIPISVLIGILSLAALGRLLR